MAEQPESPPAPLMGFTDTSKPGPAVVRVGPAPTNVLLAGTAQRVLELLFERHRDLFGALVGEAITGQQAAPPRRHRASKGQDDATTS